MACDNCVNVTPELIHAIEYFVDSFAKINQDSFGLFVVDDDGQTYKVEISKFNPKHVKDGQ